MWDRTQTVPLRRGAMTITARLPLQPTETTMVRVPFALMAETMRLRKERDDLVAVKEQELQRRLKTFREAMRRSSKLKPAEIDELERKLEERLRQSGRHR